MINGLSCFGSSVRFLLIAEIILYRLKRVGAYNVLDLAGIDGGGVAVYSEGDEKIGQYGMSLVKFF